MKIETYVLPAYWASYLLNGDASGYEDVELKEIKDFCEDLGPCIDVTDEEEFRWWNDANNLGGSVATFHFQVLKGKMKKWYALNAEGDIVYVGEHKDSKSADSVITNPVWLVDEDSAKDWLVSLSVYSQQHGWGTLK